MTGYGAGAADAATARITVEIRGVNQRFLDVKVNLPREYAAWEAEIRERMRTVAERGRVEVAVVRTAVPARRHYRVGVREDLARAYVGAARRLGRSLRLDGAVTLADVLRLPELFEVSETAPSFDPERGALRRALARAIAGFERDRRREGKHLQQDLLARARDVRRITEDVRRRVPAVRETMEARLRERLAKLDGLPAMEPERVTQEIVGLVERGDITEEIVRLESHLGALAAALVATGGVGKRVEFLLQEIQRELNTIGSKAGDLTITGLVVDGKAQVEKLREQVQNIE
jgi:uncharacterized protein (TIGR00255 family)